MVDEKKSQSNDTWAKMEQPMSMLGKFSWLIALGGAIVMAVSAIPALTAYNLAMVSYNQYIALGIGWETAAAAAQLTANAAMGQAVMYFIFAGVTVVIMLIYVLKPFSVKCAAKDWEALIADGKKMWIMWIILAVVSWWGCAGVAIPAIMLTFVGPGKGRVFGSK